MSKFFTRQLLARQFLALMLGVAGLSLVLPLTHNAAAFADGNGSDEGTAIHRVVSADDNGSDDDAISGDDDDDAGAVGGAPKASFQEGCAITDVQCLNQPVK